MSDLEVLTALVAAIIHDFDHTGTTNNFHVNSGSELAIMYNDRAVLENHHVSAFFKYLSVYLSVRRDVFFLNFFVSKKRAISLNFRMMAENNCNVFSNMQKKDYRDFRNLVIEMVLHTDMSQHFAQLKAMKVLIPQITTDPR